MLQITKPPKLQIHKVTICLRQFVSHNSQTNVSINTHKHRIQGDQFQGICEFTQLFENI